MKETSSDRLLFIAIGVSVVLAIGCGLLFGPAMAKVSFIGELFLNSLKMIIVPLVMTSIVSGVSSLGDVRKLGRMGATTVGFYAVTTFFAVVTGLIVVNVIAPGVGAEIGGHTIPDKAVGKGFSIEEVITGLITPNLFKSMAETDILPLIVFSLIFGGILTTMGGKGRLVLDVVDSLNDVFIKLVNLIMWTAPLGIFALVAARLGAAVGSGTFAEEMGRLGLYSLTVITGLGIHGFITLPIILYLVTKRNPLTYLRGMGDALLTAFSTASSSATLPLTMAAATQENGVDKRAVSFVIPLGATINMDGTALYEAVAAVYIAQAFGVELTMGDQVIVALTATLASIGAAGIPEAGLITMILVLNAVGLPLEGLGVILAVDWILDRFRTTINVWGDSCGAAVVEAIGLDPSAALSVPSPEMTHHDG